MIWPFKKRKRAKRKKPSSRPRFARRLLNAFLALLLLCVVFAGGVALGLACFRFYEFIYDSEFFALREVIITFDKEKETGDELRVESEIKRLLRGKRIPQSNLLRINTEKVADLVESHPRVYSANVQKHFPDYLMVEVRQRKPAALVLGDDIYTIDLDGAVLERLSLQSERAHEFPYITGLDQIRYEPGDQIRSRNLTKIMGLLLCLKEREAGLYGKISEAHLDKEENLILILQGGTEIRFGTGDPIAKMPALDTFIEKMGKPEEYVYIDLRFDDQIPALPKPMPDTDPVD
ncbi:MAG: cell division protein FtsQ/DivIB [Candidatus Sumerlaeia bacterium]